jgi:predicted transcriptional regulator
MDPSKLRKMQIAKRLGVSVQVLDQYLQAKRAEVLPPKARQSEFVTPPREGPKRLRHRAAGAGARDGRGRAD